MGIQLPHYIDASKVVLGIDIYHLSHVNSLHEARAAGIEFAWIKAGESDNIFDAMHDEFVERCLGADIIPGSYWFTHADKDPIKQANLFHTHGTFAKGRLIGAMDTETLNGQSGVIVGAHAKTFEATMRTSTGRGAIVYASDSFTYDYLYPSLGSGVTYWTARYGTLPKHACKFFQFADGENVTCSVPGLGQPLDVDVFYGTKADLIAHYTYL